jgi:HK97 gp10 family phage protein
MPDSLQDFINNRLTAVGAAAIEATKEIIDEEAQKLYETLKEETPVRTGGLKDSLKIEKISSQTKYGYNISYDGYNNQSQAYSYIANTLNKGTSRIKARKFIDRSIHQLKGMDNRIYKRFEEKVEKGGQNGD